VPVKIALRLTGALLLVGAAMLASREAGAARREADAWEELVTLRYERAAEAEPPAGLLAIALGDALQARRRQAAVEYWLGEFDDLVASNDESDPDVLFVAANAAYRAVRLRGATGPDAARQLDPVLQAYATVLKAAPSNTDAAFNFEYVARLRSELERMRPSPAAADAPARRTAQPARTSDLPRGPTIHGLPGGPPVNVPVEEFEVLIPRGSEAEEAPPGQAEGRKVRRKG